MAQVKEKGRAGRKVNPNWESLTRSTRVGSRLFASEVAEALGIRITSARNYFTVTPLPAGWKVCKVEGKVFIERTEGR